jgi:hypothetical protein
LSTGSNNIPVGQKRQATDGFPSTDPKRPAKLVLFIKEIKIFKEVIFSS